MFKSRRYQRFLTLVFAITALSGLAMAEGGGGPAWWNNAWPVRKKIDIDTSDKGIAISEPIGTATVLLRLHEGVFNFLGSKEDGSDLRIVADDQKTELKHHIEKWDSLLNEAYVWVQIPDLKSSAATSVWLYSGNVTDATAPALAKESYDADTTLIYHFADTANAAVDSSASGVRAEGVPAPAAGLLLSGGLRLFGQTPITIPANPALEWAPGGSLTLAMWVKPTALQPNAIILSRREGSNAVLLGLDNGVPFVEINKQRSSSGQPMAAGGWHHLAVTVNGAATTLYLDGKQYGTLAGGIPAAFKGPITLDKDTSAGAAAGFTGEFDELQMSKTARAAGFIRLLSVNQGATSDAAKLVVIGPDEVSGHEGENEIMKHLTLITDISKDLTFDGWVVIVLCVILAVVGWLIAIGKFMYLNTSAKATKEFMKRWEKISSDLTAIDHTDSDNIKSMGGTVSGKAQKLMRQSPVYHIYHIGSDEIRKRKESKEGFNGLSSRSIQAIKATLDGGLTREVQKLNSKLVFLTIGIAGGPYLGLLGTVIGVMITFAVIAKSGEVEVNSIAPGIAGALLATVAGLAVAIPALFAYSYLSSRIKDAVTDMQIFIDEFLAKMAELYPTSND